jgi:glycosyltransferase involved in cell wall biosynthesis
MIFDPPLPETPTVAVDCRALSGQPTGVGRFLAMLVDALELLPVDIRAYVGDLPAYRIGTRVEVVAIGSRGIAWHASVVRDLRARPVSAYLSTSLLIPALAPIPALPLILDTTTFLVPKLHRFRTVAFERALMPLVARRRTIATMSQTSARDIERFARPRKPVCVIPPWVEPRATQADVDQRLAGLGLAVPYLLFVGTIEPRKNVLVAVEAIDLLRASGVEVRLVLVGSMGWADSNLRARIELGVRRGSIVQTGYLTDADRDAAYAGAAAVVMPSLYEGFGLPVIEAMSRGIPVLCSDAPALVEAAGSAAVVLGAHDAEGWASAIRTMLNSPDLRRQRVADGLARAGTFTKGRTALAVAEALREGGLIGVALYPGPDGSIGAGPA